MGTHPIFESDFDCLTECQNPAHRHPHHPPTDPTIITMMINGSQMSIMARLAFKFELFALTKLSTFPPPSKSVPASNWSMLISPSIAFALIIRQIPRRHHHRHDSVHI